jgi:N-acetylglucosamine kinase-like BadF-type ATPase
MLNRLSSVVGVDGGGTKTEAVIIDADQRVIGEGRAGPSNPLRVGIAAAAAAVREAIDDACASAKLRRPPQRIARTRARNAGAIGRRRH